MSLTPSDRRYHRIYEALPQSYQAAIDEAWSAAADTLRGLNLSVAGDDRAEALAGAITRLVIESNPEDAAIKAAIAEVDGLSTTIFPYPVRVKQTVAPEWVQYRGQTGVATATNSDASRLRITLDVSDFTVWIDRGAVDRYTP